MKVILISDVKSLGKKGDVVEVSDGYGKNYLIPRKLGLEATNANLNDLKLKKANDVKMEKEAKEEAERLADDIKTKPVTIKAKLGTSKKLFGAITSKEIANSMRNQHGMVIDKKKIVLDEPIKELGSYSIKIKLHRDVAALLTVNVVEDNG